MKNLFAILTILLISICQTNVFADIHILDQCAIVADAKEWTCKKTKVNFGVSFECIHGKSTNLPIEFDYFNFGVDEKSLNILYDRLSSYAVKQNIVLSDVKKRVNIDKECIILEGLFQGNRESGHFIWFVPIRSKNTPSNYSMFIKVREIMTDENYLNHLCEETYALGRPVITTQ